MLNPVSTIKDIVLNDELLNFYMEMLNRQYEAQRNS